MKLLAPFLKKSASPYAGTASGIFPGAAAHTDIYQNDIAPSALTLIRENLGTAYACGALNSQLVAKTRLRLFVRTGRGEAPSRLSKYGRTKAISDYQFERLEKGFTGHTFDAANIEEVTNHPLLNLLYQPNAAMQDGVGMSLFSLIEITQLFLEIVGRSYWWVAQDGPGKTPSQIWVLAPQYVTEWPGFGEDAPIIAYYEFALGSGKQRYSPDQVVPFRFPDPATGGYTGGISPLRAVFEQHKIIRQTDATTSARVKNGGKPDAMFIPKGDEFGGSIGRDEAARLELILKRRYAMAGAGSIMVSDIPGDLKPMAWPINDVVDAARLALGEKKIAQAYHVPFTKLNRDVANRASAESGDYAHAIDAGLPRLRRIESALNTFLMGMYGDEARARLFVAFDDPPGLENPETENKRFELAVKRGAIKGNEIRSRCGMTDVPEGEQYLADAGLVPLLPDGKPDPAYYRGANPQLAEADDDVEKKPEPSQAPATEPAKTQKRKPSKTAKALLKLAKAVEQIAQKSAETRDINANTTTDSGETHKFSCVMADLPNPLASEVLSFVATIPQDQLADDGRETEPHTTVLYGLHTDSADDVRDVLKGEPPITLKLGAIECFPANENRPDSDVIVVSVKSRDLERQNAKLRSALECTSSYTDYRPHVTIAYVAPGLGQRYVGDARFKGKTATIDRICFSDRSGHKQYFALEGDASRQLLKSKGYTDPEIDAAIESERRSHSEL